MSSLAPGPRQRWGLVRLLLLSLGLFATSAQARATLSVQPGMARPGDPILVTVRGLSGEPTGTLAGRPLRFYPTPDGFQAASGLPVEQLAGEVEVKVTSPAAPGVELVGTLEVEAPTWPTRELRVATMEGAPPPHLRRRLEADRAAFAAAFNQPYRPPLFAQDFAWPRHDRITAPFGDRRTFNGELKSQHFGTDVDGDTGDPIHAANDGVVVMVRDNYAAGRTVMLHHGGGIYTTYFHLSRIEVKSGARVKRGQRLGRVGGTGRVTGPHLHWGAKVDGLWVDPETLLRLDFV